MTERKNSGELKQALQLCRASFFVVLAFSLAINLLLLTPAFYMLQVYDRVIPSASLPTLLMLTLVVLLLFATIGALEWVRSQILLRTGARFDTLLEARGFEVSFRQALYTSGQAAQARSLADLSVLRQFISGNALLAFFDAPWLPLYLLVMYWFHPLFGLVGLLSALVLLGLALLNARLGRDTQAELGEESSALESFVLKNLRNAEVIEAMGMLGDIRNRWQSRYQSLLARQLQRGSTAGALASLSRTFRLTVQSLVLGLGAYLVIEQRLTPGLMIAGSILLGRALAPVDQLISGWRQFVQARLAYRRFDGLLQKIPPLPERMSLPAPEGLITAEQLSLAPPGTRNLVLRNVSFRIEPGDSVAIVGPSGSGKTSLARAVLGIWPVTGGKLRLDGAEVYTWNREDLGPHVGYLPQDVELFEGSVSENIARFGTVDAAAVVEAARQAGVHEAILSLPGGYDMQIGAGGSALSAGQRQRLALARSLYGNPCLLVLDEPNSNLDDRGELALIEALRAQKERGATVLVISHRKTILAAVDKLMVLGGGGVTHFGPKEEVLEALQSQARRRQRDSAVGS
ncbi:type I secretion system permease/ATPase [Parahaliea maris]|uniref:type I secretion system permease/ATPase n=1 Tax=Parahaliea maris TaxID=2716870 RepID=UPI001BB3B8BF|nr:type I secretion system permease/ATPase [Parahaliea maris]